jgi:NifB/MoaA-like Fe-S oxidoreductase
MCVESFSLSLFYWAEGYGADVSRKTARGESSRVSRAKKSERHFNDRRPIRCECLAGGRSEVLWGPRGDAAGAEALGDFCVVHRPQEAGEAIDQVDRVRERALDDRGNGWAYAADEMYLHAERPLPPQEYYDSWDLTENGVGSVSGFLSAFGEGVAGVPSLPGKRLRILTGASMAPFMRDLAAPLENATGSSVVVECVRNEFYGESVTVAGLLAGRDLMGGVPDPAENDLILIPAEALNADDLFIDSVSLEDFRRALAPARVLPAFEITEALRSL